MQQKHLVVLEAAFTLAPGNLEDIQATMDDLTEKRNKTAIRVPIMW